MQKTQGKYIVGYVTVKIRGKNLEQFLQYCMHEGIRIWNIEMVSRKECTATVYWHQVSKLENLMDELPYEIRIKKPKGLFPAFQRFWGKKEIIISVIVCVAFVFILSNIVWKLEITGVTKELDEKIRTELAAHGLYEGAWTFNLEKLDTMQHQLLHEIPELLYIGIYKNGTTYHVDAEEKLIEKEKEKQPIQDLVATKNGVIHKVFIKNGIAQVEVHDVVQKGDVLVSGTIDVEENSKEEQEDTEEETKEEKVPAEGKIYANTWYEMDVITSIYPQYEKLNGDKRHHYKLAFNNFTIPIWGFRSPPFSETFTEVEKEELQFLNYTLPVAFIDKTIYDKETIKNKRTHKEAKEIAISYIKEDLQLRLGSDAQIVNYKVLHETEENGKVKMNLYISVIEDIAQEQPLE